MNISNSKSLILMLLTVFLGSNAFSAVIPIYKCSNENLVKNSNDNPKGIQSITVTVEEEQDEALMVAGRPSLFVKGTFTKGNVEQEFELNIVGTPEFLGVNMFHTYFTGSYTSISGLRPSNFKLVSYFSKHGNSQANLSVDNRNSAIPGGGMNLILNDVGVSCAALSSSIYLK